MDTFVTRREFVVGTVRLWSLLCQDSELELELYLLFSQNMLRRVERARRVMIRRLERVWEWEWAIIAVHCSRENQALDTLHCQ